MDTLTDIIMFLKAIDGHAEEKASPYVFCLSEDIDPKEKNKSKNCNTNMFLHLLSMLCSD